MLLALLAVAWVLPQPAWGLRIVTYNVLNYSSGRVSYFQPVINGMEPDLLVVQEILSQSAVDYFLDYVLNGAGGPGGFAAATFYNGPDTDNALFYRTDKLTFDPGDPNSFIRLTTALRDINRWKLTPVGYGDGASFYIYSMHLKASTGSDNEAKREAEATIVRNDANALPAGTHFIYGGDFNCRSSSEDAYDEQLTGHLANDNGRGFDPIETPGPNAPPITWHLNYGLRIIMSQSPRGDFGGMDDRFDFLLDSAAFQDDEGLAYVEGTYLAYGNDGEHFDAGIDDYGFNNAVGMTIATALRLASDHIPVLADYQVPAKVTADSSLDFGAFIVGTVAEQALAVGNGGDTVTFPYIDELNYTLSAPAGFVTDGGPFTDEAGGDLNEHVVSMDTSTADTLSGTLEVASNDVDDPTVDVPVSGTVLNHARPSLDEQVETTSEVLDFGSVQAPGFVDGHVLIHNFDYDSLQAVLNVYDAAITGPDAGRFSIVDGFSPVDVSVQAEDFTVRFDADGAETGLYEAVLTFSTQDSPDVNGGEQLADLVVDLLATVTPLPFDCNADGDVDLQDFFAFQTCFTGPGGSLAPGCECADSDGDDDVDLQDFFAFQTAYTGPG